MAYETTVIIRSRAQCLSCGDVVESVHRHDFVQCRCGALFLDGGTSYVRWGAKDMQDVKFLTDTRPKTRSEVLSDIARFQSYGSGVGHLIEQAHAYLETIDD
jgi:hypothetical protein